MSHFFQIRFITLAWVTTAAAQPIPSDEIRSKTVPYVPPSSVTLRTEVRVVEVPVVVRDQEFRAVGGLTRDDFEIYDDGKMQSITAFSVQSATATKGALQPRFLALCFDDLHLPVTLLEAVKGAAERFAKTGLAPGDRVVVVRSSRSEEARFTSDVAALVEQIEKVTAAPQPEAGDSLRVRIQPDEAYQIANHLDPGDRLLQEKLAECSRYSDPRNPCPASMIAGEANLVWTRARSGTVNLLGMLVSLVGSMAKLPGERMILLTSAGFLTGTLNDDVDRLLDKARRADVVINGVDARGQQGNAVAAKAYDVEAILSAGTGRTLYENQNDLAKGFRQLGSVPEAWYLLGFAPAGNADGSFHRLKVQLAWRKRFSVEARLGYTARVPEPSLSKLDDAVMASGTIADLPALFTFEHWEARPGITVVAHLDIGRLRFKPWQDRRTQKLTIVVVRLDNHGAFVAGKRSELELSFKDGTFAKLKETGFPVALTLNVPAGSYSVRAVAEDAMEGKLAAASGAIEIK